MFPIPWCSFTLFKNNVKLDPILRQPKEFLRKPKTRDKKVLRKIRGGRLKYLGFAIWEDKDKAVKGSQDSFASKLRTWSKLRNLIHLLSIIHTFD